MHNQDSQLSYRYKQNSRIGLDAPGFALLGIGVSFLGWNLLQDFLEL
jgi:hypothetical protein